MGTKTATSTFKPINHGFFKLYKIPLSPLPPQPIQKNQLENDAKFHKQNHTLW